MLQKFNMTCVRLFCHHVGTIIESTNINNRADPKAFCSICNGRLQEKKQRIKAFEKVQAENLRGKEDK